MSFDELHALLASRVQGNPHPKPVKFDFGEDGVIVLDGANVWCDDRPAVCTIHIALKDFSALLCGQLDPLVAFGMNKIRVTGDNAHALSLVERVR